MMIQVAASKEFSITFTVLVITASLESLFVIPRLSYESTSLLTNSFEVSYAMAYYSLHYTKKEINVVGLPNRALKNKGIVDSGCSRHMTGNKAYLLNFRL
ncbi:hypothetical protein Tco_0544814 [Tanacetum coccineum]